MPAKTPPLNDLSAREWIKFTKSWFVPPRGANDRAKQAAHPATFPLQLAADFIQFFTREGETVLDPFLGAGTTLEAADQLNRQAVGIELEPDFAEFAASRSRQTIHIGDALTLANDRELLPDHSVDYILTSPPYWNILHQSRGGNPDTRHKKRLAQGQSTIYSDNPKDLGNIADANKYLQKLTTLFTDLHRVLKPKSYVTIIIQNVNAAGSLQPIAWQLGITLSQTRLYDLKGEKIWCKDAGRLGIYGYPTTYHTNNLHHYCLTFRQIPASNSLPISQPLP